MAGKEESENYSRLTVWAKVEKRDHGSLVEY